jgi:hypothetical protein
MNDSTVWDRAATSATEHALKQTEAHLPPGGGISAEMLGKPIEMLVPERFEIGLNPIETEEGTMVMGGPGSQPASFKVWATLLIACSRTPSHGSKKAKGPMPSLPARRHRLPCRADPMPQGAE